MNIQTRFGPVMELHHSNYIDRVICEEGFYESEVLDSLLYEAGPNCVFWDIGANIGTHSLAFKFLKQDASVISFEPDASNFCRLRRNCILNNLAIELMNFPLSDRFELALLYSVTGNHGQSTLAPYPDANFNANPGHVFGVSGDFLVENNLLPVPDLVKLDVEGYELKAIKGMKETLAKGKTKKIILEAHQSFLKEDSELKDLLRDLGYSIKKLERQEKTHHCLDNFEAHL
jgi:FkbM family methyltransferase